MKIVLLIIAVGITLNSCQAINADMSYEKLSFAAFQEYVKEYHKEYSSIEEYMVRFEIYKSNINKLNKPKKSFTEGINQFIHMTHEELQKQYLSFDFTQLNSIPSQPITIQAKGNLPEAFDWREQGAVGPVKDQGICGSCWAFSSITTLEASYYIKYGQLLRFSEQQIVDCDADDWGCEGGWMEGAFKWLKENGGIMLEEDYPYNNRQSPCKFDPEKAKAQIGEYVKVGATNEELMKELLIEYGPLAVTFNANPIFYYSEGIIDLTEAECDPILRNHAVSIVGYGKQIDPKDKKDKEFWIVKNSWGEKFGEKGYFRMALGKGVCGIDQHVVYASIK